MNFEIKEFYKGVFEELQARATKQESSQPINILDYYLFKLENEEKEEHTSTSFNEELLPYTKWSISMHGLEAEIEVILHETKEYIARHYEEFVHALGHATHAVITFLDEQYKVAVKDLEKAVKELQHLMEVGWHKFEEALRKGKELIIAFANRLKTDVDSLRQKFLVTNAIAAEGLKLESLSVAKGKAVKEVSYYLGMLHGLEMHIDPSTIHHTQHITQSGHDALALLGDMYASDELQKRAIEIYNSLDNDFKYYLTQIPQKIIEAKQISRAEGLVFGDALYRVLKLPIDFAKENGIIAAKIQVILLLAILGPGFVYGVYMAHKKTEPVKKLLLSLGFPILMYAVFVLIAALSYTHHLPPGLKQHMSDLSLFTKFGTAYGEGIVESKLTFFAIALGLTGVAAGFAMGELLKAYRDAGKKVARSAQI